MLKPLQCLYFLSHCCRDCTGHCTCVCIGENGDSYFVILEQRQTSQGLPLKLSLLPPHCLFLLSTHFEGHLPDPDSLDPCHSCVFSHLRHDLDWCFHLLKTTRMFAGKFLLEWSQVIIAIYSLSETLILHFPGSQTRGSGA